MNVTTALPYRLLNLLLPDFCLDCRTPLAGHPEPLGLCLACRGRLRRLPSAGCWLCGRPISAWQTTGQSCGPCRRRSPAYDRLVAAWSYQPPLQAVIHGLKYGRLDYLGAHLARALVEGWGRELSVHDLVVPVPLHWRRRLLRGYNQAELIALPLARELGLPLRRHLRRVVPTAPQSRLPRAARMGNVRGVFRLRHAWQLVGIRVLLVDDVVTTGATLHQAARCLKSAGVSSITAVAAGRTPAAP